MRKVYPSLNPEVYTILLEEGEVVCKKVSCPHCYGRMWRIGNNGDEFPCSCRDGFMFEEVGD